MDQLDSTGRVNKQIKLSRRGVVIIVVAAIVICAYGEDGEGWNTGIRVEDK